MAIVSQEELEWDFLAQLMGPDTSTAISDRVELEERCVPDPAKEDACPIVLAIPNSDSSFKVIEGGRAGHQPSSDNNQKGERTKRKRRALCSLVAVEKGKARSKRYECEHGRYKYQCKDCRGSSRCQHNLHFGFCMQCDSRYLCRHGKSKYTCSRCKA